MAITGADIARGEAAEATFAAWLDRSCLPFAYATPTRESVARQFQGQLKRPDYLVAVPMVGTLCFGVKAKTRYQGGFIFDSAEVNTLAAFDDLFNLTTLFACLDTDGGTASWWFRVADLDRRPDDRRGGRLTVSVRDGLAVDLERLFQEALRDLVSL